MSTEVGRMSERNVTDDSRQVCTILCRSLEELSRTVQLSMRIRGEHKPVRRIDIRTSRKSDEYDPAPLQHVMYTNSNSRARRRTVHVSWHMI
jgi:hypothetical protein